MGNPSATVQGTLTSIYNIGCFLGSLSTLYTGDRLGRPRTLIFGSSVIALGAIVQASCYSRGQMYAGRVIAGLGTGMNTATAGVWQSETSKMRSRGKLVIIQMANCITGFCLSNWLTLGFSFCNGSVAWRFPLAFQCCTFSDLYHHFADETDAVSSFHPPDLADVPLPPGLAPSADP
jgi:MFS family permease